MVSIDTIDHYFKVEKVRNVLAWHSITAGTPGLYGLMQHPDGRFCRIPKEVAEAVNAESDTENVITLYTNTSGGRFRFITNSQTVAVRVTLGASYGSSRSTFLGTAGMDLYQNTQGTWRYVGCLAPENLTPSEDDPRRSTYEAALRFGTAQPRVLMLHFPLYADVHSVQIGLETTVIPMQARGYGNRQKLVFYGSSITQGGCAPSPGNSYPAILSRRLDMDFVDLGFSAGAKAEPSMVDYLCRLPMDLLVYDYDHNAPSPEHLRATHLKTYQMVRQRRPDLPIVMASAPFAHLDDIWAQRREIVLDTYRHALAQGDTWVEFVDGATMYPAYCQEECTVDGIHPNGLGMSCMANAFEPAIRRLLGTL